MRTKIRVASGILAGLVFILGLSCFAEESVGQEDEPSNVKIECDLNRISRVVVAEARLYSVPSGETEADAVAGMWDKLYICNSNMERNNFVPVRLQMNGKPARDLLWIARNDIAGWSLKEVADVNFFVGVWEGPSDPQRILRPNLTIEKDMRVYYKQEDRCEIESENQLYCSGFFPDGYSYLGGNATYHASGVLRLEINIFMGYGFRPSPIEDGIRFANSAEFEAFRCGNDVLCVKGLGIMARKK